MYARGTKQSRIRSYMYKENVKINIIVPVYNAEKYIERCMESLINQTYRNIEVICVNDGSTDNSLSVLKRYAKKDNRITVIDKENEGVSLARNKGIELACGQYLMFVDADDWIEPTTCEVALAEMLKENADVIMWPYIREFKDKSVPKKIWDSDKLVFKDTDVQTKLHRRFVGLLDKELSMPESADALCTIWGKLYDGSLIKQNKILFKDIRELGTYEDGLFNLDVFGYVKKVVYINQFFYHYRKDNDASITTKYNVKLRKQWNNLFGYMREYINEKQLPVEYYKAYDNRVALSVLGLGLNVLNSQMSVMDKIKELKSIISSKEYRQACKKLQLKYFPIHWKVFYGCAKYNIAFGVYILLVCIKKIIAR